MALCDRLGGENISGNTGCMVLQSLQCDPLVLRFLHYVFTLSAKYSKLTLVVQRFIVSTLSFVVAHNDPQICQRGAESNQLLMKHLLSIRRDGVYIHSYLSLFIFLVLTSVYVKAFVYSITIMLCIKNCLPYICMYLLFNNKNMNFKSSTDFR